MRTNVGGCARGLCAKGVRWGCALRFVRACAPQRGTVACAWGLCARLCAQVVRPLCALRVKSIVRFERHNPFGLFRIAISAWHNPFDHCAKFISLIFFSVKYSINLHDRAQAQHRRHVLWYVRGPCPPQFAEQKQQPQSDKEKAKKRQLHKTNTVGPEGM